jgi:phosphoinositide-3-kinase regulatory subunit 4
MYDMALQQHTDAVLPDARIEKLCLRYGEAISALTTLVDDQGTQFFTTCTSGLQSMRRDSVGSLPSLAKERTVTELKRQASVTSSRYSVDSIDSLRKAPEASGITLSALLTASKELLSQIEADISALRQNGTIPAASDREERIRAQSPFILAETAFAKAQELGTSPAKVMEMDYGLLQQLAKMQSSDALESSSEPNTAPRARTRISFDGPILLVQFVCSSIRHVRYPQTRMVALQLLVRLGLICSDVVLLQRIIPYAVDLLHDPVTPVRAVAVVALRTLLTLVETFTAFDSNLFPRYIFPALNEIARETEEVVRVAFVESIGRFAEASKKFLDRAQLMRQMKAISEQTDEKSSPSGSERTTMGAVAPLVEGSYDKQLRQLHDQVCFVVA